MSVEEKNEIIREAKKGSWAKFIITGVLSGFSAAFTIGVWTANNAAWKEKTATTLLEVKTSQEKFQEVTNNALADHSAKIVNVTGRVIFLEARKAK